MPLSWEISGAGDFNRDGHDDLVWRNMQTGAVGQFYLDDTTITFPPGCTRGGAP